MQCPKCRGTMRTHNRNNVHIEQCDSCRGIFLDYGELETLTQLQNQWVANMPPPGPAPVQPPMGGQPAWGAPQAAPQVHHHVHPPAYPHAHHGHHPKYYKKRGLMGMLFSS